MSVAAVAAARAPGLQGVHVGAIALATGVVVEAVASRFMTRGVVAELQAGPAATAAADSRGADSRRPTPQPPTPEINRLMAKLYSPTRTRSPTKAKPMPRRVTPSPKPQKRRPTTLSTPRLPLKF